jgi:hypothetical protein
MGCVGVMCYLWGLRESDQEIEGGIKGRKKGG